MSNVRSYTDNQLLSKVKSLDSFTVIPKGHWIIGIQSLEDEYDCFDDKFYLFKGEKFIMVMSGTTNAGSKPMLNYRKYHPLGVAVLKTNEWYYDCWAYGLHKGRMPALRQIRPMKFFRDGNKNRKIEEIGKYKERMIGCNFHTATYSADLNFFRLLIGGWSAVCQVTNRTKPYYTLLSRVRFDDSVTYCLLKEFKP